MEVTFEMSEAVPNYEFSGVVLAIDTHRYLDYIKEYRKHVSRKVNDGTIEKRERKFWNSRHKAINIFLNIVDGPPGRKIGDINGELKEHFQYIEGLCLNYWKYDES